VNQEVRVQLPSDTLAAHRAMGSIHECAPGRAGSLQNCFTGFNSSRSCLMSRWCSGFALNPPKVQALVQIQVGILIHAACECAGLHGSPRNCKTRFNSSAGCHEIYVLGVCWMGMQPCEG
jgi:hypothetical protein